MINFLKLNILAVLMFLLSALNSSAASTSPIPPHTPQLEAESFVSSPVQKTAGIYWLPDYLKDNLDRNSNGSNPSPEGGDKDNACSDYGFQSTKPDANLYDFDTKANVTTDDNGNWITCYDNVKCKTKFQYTSTNCNGDKKPTGASCGGKYETCQILECSSGFTKNLTSCPNTTGYTYSTGTPAGTAVCGKCTAKTCPSGSSTSTTCDNVNTKCTLNGYSGTSPCYSSANIPCPTGKTNCTYGCNKYDTSRVAMCGQICTECKTCTPNCTNQSSCTYGSYAVDNGCGGTCTKCYTDNCHNRTAATCPAGCQSYFSDCSSKCQVCKPTCSTSYIYSSSNCNGWHEPGGSSCEGKYNECNDVGSHASYCYYFKTDASSRKFTVTSCDQLKSVLKKVINPTYAYKSATLIISGTISNCNNPFDVLNDGMYHPSFYNITGENSSARFSGAFNPPACTEVSNLNIDGTSSFDGVNRINNVTFNENNSGDSPIRAPNAKLEFTGKINITSNNYTAIDAGFGMTEMKLIFDNATAVIRSPSKPAIGAALSLEINKNSDVTLVSPKNTSNYKVTIDATSALKVKGADFMSSVEIRGGTYYYDSTGAANGSTPYNPQVFSGGKYITNNLKGTSDAWGYTIYACDGNGAMLYGHAPGQLVGTYKCTGSNRAGKISDTPSIALPSF